MRNKQTNLSTRKKKTTHWSTSKSKKNITKHDTKHHNFFWPIIQFRISKKNYLCFVVVVFECMRDVCKETGGVRGSVFSHYN